MLAYLYENQPYRSDTHIQLFTFSFIHCHLFIYPPLFVCFIILITLLHILLSGCHKLLNIDPLCQVPQLLLRLIECTICLTFQYVKLSNNSPCNKIDDMIEATSLVWSTWKTLDQFRQLINHCIIVWCIVASDRKDLPVTRWIEKKFLVGFWQTLSKIPKSSRIFANAAARFNPECDFATSTRSRSIHKGMPLFSRWTVTATKALWLGDVHALVAKFSAPSCSCNIFAMHFRVFAKTILTSHETVDGDGIIVQVCPSSLGS